MTVFNDDRNITIEAGGIAFLPFQDILGGFVGAGTIVMNGGITLHPGSTTGVEAFSGVIYGAGGIQTDLGGGVQVLSGANVFWGGSTIASSGAAIQLGHSNAMRYSTVTVDKSNGLTFTKNLGAATLGGLSGSQNLALLDTDGAPIVLTVGRRIDDAITFATYTGALSGAGAGLTKTGSGTQTLTGANTYTGSTTIERGTLIIEGTASSTQRLASASSLVFKGTGFFNSKASSPQPLAALKVDAGDADVTSTAASTSGGLTFATPPVVARGATVNLATSGGTAGLSNRIILTGAATGFLGSGIFSNNSAFAWYDASGVVRDIIYGTDPGTATTFNATSLTSLAHRQATGSVTAQQTATFTTLRLGASAFTLAPGAIVTVDGLIKNGSQATLSGGAGIHASTDAALIVRTPAFADQFILDTPILADGVNAFVKSGAGLLTLGTGAINTYTGGTYLNQGRLAISQASHLGANVPGNSTTFDGGTLTLQASLALGANQGLVVRAGGGVLVSNTTTSTLTLNQAGALAGDGPLTTIANLGSRDTIVLESSATQPFSGVLTVDLGTIATGAAGVSDPFGRGDIAVTPDGRVSVRHTGTTWSNRFLLETSNDTNRGSIRARRRAFRRRSRAARRRDRRRRRRRSGRVPRRHPRRVWPDVAGIGLDVHDRADRLVRRQHASVYHRADRRAGDRRRRGARRFRRPTDPRGRNDFLARHAGGRRAQRHAERRSPHRPRHQRRSRVRHRSERTDHLRRRLGRSQHRRHPLQKRLGHADARRQQHLRVAVDTE
ncbi:MAG: autotransporter-associated beta strand repeat-containing protein [Pirellulales bacterium]